MGKSNIAEFYKIPYDMMLVSGIWPVKNPSYVYRVKTISSWCFAIGLLIIQLMEAISDITDFAKLSQTLYIMAAVLAYIIKLAAFTCQSQNFLKMVSFLKDPIFTSYSDNYDHHMVKNIKLANIAAKALKYCYLSCVFLYLVYPIVDHVPLPFPFPYDLGKYTFLMYIFQIAAEGSAAWNNACLDTLCICMMGISIAQLEILAEKIIRIGQNHIGLEDFQTSEKNKQYVKHHLAIIRYVEYVEQIFSVGIFLQFMISILMICNTLFHIMLITVCAQLILLAVYSVGMILQLFTYCWFGNEIIIKSRELGDACYESNWYSNNQEIGRYIFIIMERSKRPLRITSMKFITLSLTTFASILQWSYSCLTLLLKMYDERSA